MSVSDDIPILDRPSFFDGQRLTAADLAAVQAFHRELRWLHNRSLHSWGIAFGYAVSGQKGDRVVRLAPGYAVDCNGRDLIQSQPLTLAIPAVAGASDGGSVTYYLTASYADDSSLTPQTQSGMCGTAGAVRRSEQPIIRWQQDSSDADADSPYRRGEDVILATIQVQNCQLLKDVSIAERRDAVPAQQPYIAAGQTEAGKTEWQLFPNKDNPIGVKAIVSTGSAGFRTPPRYQAHIVGDRLVRDTVNEQARQFVVDGYAQVAGASATQFEMQVILPSGTTVGSGLSAEVTSEDFQAVVRVIAERIGGINPEVATFILQTLKGRISVGQPVSSSPIIPEDFDQFLSTIATRLSTSIDQLLADNQLTRQTLTLAVGDRLINPNAILLLNPLDIVFEEDFLIKLKTTLNWHVVWMGIEG